MRRIRLSSAGLLALVVLLLAACSGHGAPDISPGDARSQLEFGVKMARRGLWSEALFRFEQARNLDPSNARILNNLAVASEALGNFEDAQRYYQDALRLAPNDAEVKRNYVRFTEFYVAYRAGGQEAEGQAESGEGR